MEEYEFQPRYRIGNEAMQYKNDSKLFPRLEKAIADLRAVGNYEPNAIAQSGISKIIMEETGINVILSVEKYDSINACVYIPEIDRNNPIVNNFIRGYRSNADLHKVLSFTNGTFNGLVDKKKGKVAGDFSKIAIPVMVTLPLMASKSYSDMGVAVIIGHELGHIWSYFERLVDLVSMNYAASYVAERVLKTGTDADRIILLTEYEKELNVTLTEKETIASSENGATIYTHLVCESLKQRRNEEDDMTYSWRGFEFSSDQFVTRHGGGRELATALAQLSLDGWNVSSWSWPAYCLLNIFNLIMFLSAMGILVYAGMWGWALFWSIITIGSNPMMKSYDEPRERLDRIRNELVGALKEAPSTQVRGIINADIAAVDAISADFTDKTSWHEAIHYYLLPTGRKDRKKQLFQQELEKLMNNDLFVAAARLENSVV